MERLLIYDDPLTLVRDRTIRRASTTHDERYFYIKVDHPYVTRATVFLRRKKGDLPWYGSAAFCSKDDNFSRKIGRNTARRRFFQKPSNAVMFAGYVGDYDAAQDIMHSFLPV